MGHALNGKHKSCTHITKDSLRKLILAKLKLQNSNCYAGLLHIHCLPILIGACTVMVQISPKCDIDHKDSDVYIVLSFYLLCLVT